MPRSDIGFQEWAELPGQFKAVGEREAVEKRGGQASGFKAKKAGQEDELHEKVWAVGK